MTILGNTSGKISFDEFTTYLLKFDELAVVLKCHLRLEQEVDRALKKIFPKPDTILDWSFLEKIELLNRLGIIKEDITQKFRKFNSLRNKFSHKYNYQLSSEELSFLESVSSNKKLIIPDKLKGFPRIREIALIARTAVYLEGWLAGRIYLIKP